MDPLRERDCWFKGAWKDRESYERVCNGCGGLATTIYTSNCKTYGCCHLELWPDCGIDPDMLVGTPGDCFCGKCFLERFDIVGLNAPMKILDSTVWQVRCMKKRQSGFCVKSARNKV